MMTSDVALFVRLRQLVGDKRAKPPVPGMLPMSAATVWRLVNEGTFPAPVKLGANTTAWRMSDVQAWADAFTEGGAK
jgi:predicted DNA-binding transcriptional regulator AlpA